MSTTSDVSNTGEKKVVTFKIRHEDPYRFRIAYTDENADRLYELFQQKIAEFDRPIKKILYGDNFGVDQIANANDLKVAMQSGDYLKLYAIVDDGDATESNSSSSSSEDNESIRRRQRRHRQHPPNHSCGSRRSHCSHGPVPHHGYPFFTAGFPCNGAFPSCHHFNQFGYHGCYHYPGTVPPCCQSYWGQHHF